MLYFKEHKSYVVFLWVVLVILASYKLGLIGAMSTVYGFMLLAFVIGVSILSVLALLILAYAFIKERK